MKVYKEQRVFTRREFLKGSGMIALAMFATGVFAKLGITSYTRSTEYISQRAAGLYTLDEKSTIRRSHENPEILTMYQEYLSPGGVTFMSERAHHLLHTAYGAHAMEGAAA